MSNLRSDGEKGLNGEKMRNFLKENRIKFFSSGSLYTNKNRIVDRVIRTIRDMYLTRFGRDKVSPSDHYKRILQLASIYNNTYQREIKMAPIEMQKNYEKELNYINQKKNELAEVLKRQSNDGLLDYKPDDELMVFIDHSKEGNSQLKKGTQTYSEKMKFLNYENGNVRVKTKNGNEIVVPIYHTIKYSEDNKLEIPNNRRKVIKNKPGPKPKTHLKNVKKKRIVKKIKKE